MLLTAIGIVLSRSIRDVSLVLIPTLNESYIHTYKTKTNIMKLPSTSLVQNGVFAERLFGTVLQGLGYQNLAEKYSVKLLHQLLNEFDQDRLYWLQDKYSDDTSPARIVDYAFGVDYIVNVKPTNQKIGIDFTLDDESLKRKVGKAKRNKRLWRNALRLDTMLVVCFKLPEGDDQGLLFYDLQDCEDQLLDALFLALESPEECLSTTIKVRRK